MANMVKLTNSKRGERPVDGRGIRFAVMLTGTEDAAIQDFRFANRIATKATAARLLMQLGLQAFASGAELPKEPQDTAFATPPE